MKGKVNVMAPHSREILFAPSLHGFEKERGRFGNKKKKGEGETKHISQGTEGLEAKHTSFFFPTGGGEENNSSHESVPNESTTTSLNK